jgi:hypothetical protein
MVETVDEQITPTHTIVVEQAPVTVAPIVSTAPVMHTHSVVDSSVHVSQVPGLPIKKKKVKKVKKRRMGPKRPPSSFILYSMDMRPKLRAERTDLKTVGARSTVLAGMWKDLPMEKKQKYLDMAKERKAKYLKEMEEFKKKLQEHADEDKIRKDAQAAQAVAIHHLQQHHHHQAVVSVPHTSDEIAVPVPTSHVPAIMTDHIVPVPTVQHTTAHSVPTVANI